MAAKLIRPDPEFPFQFSFRKEQNRGKLWGTMFVGPPGDVDTVQYQGDVFNLPAEIQDDEAAHTWFKERVMERAQQILDSKTERKQREEAAEQERAAREAALESAPRKPLSFAAPAPTPEPESS